MKDNSIGRGFGLTFLGWEAWLNVAAVIRATSSAEVPEVVWRLGRGSPKAARAVPSVVFLTGVWWLNSLVLGEPPLGR